MARTNEPAVVPTDGRHLPASNCPGIYTFPPADTMDVSEEPTLETVVGLLDDEYARTILTAVSTEHMSATELADHCDCSLPTAYRRLDRLECAGLVAERTRPRSDGHHDTVYTATLDEVSIRLRDGELELAVDRRDDPAGRLAELWGDL